MGWTKEVTLRQVNGAALERLLFEAGINQEKFAALAKLHPVTVSRHKTGVYTRIRGDAAGRFRAGLTKALRRPVDLDEFTSTVAEQVPAA